MADIRPFRGLRYDLARAGNPADLMASTAALRDADALVPLRARSRYNVAQLVADAPAAAGEEGVGARLRRWVREGRLRRDAEPSFYAVDQTWAGAAGKIVRRGFLGLLRLDDTGGAVRLLHPRQAAADVGQLAELQAGLSPVLALFDDPAGEVQTLLTAARSAFPDVVTADDRGIEHRLFPIPGQWETQRLIQFMAKRPVTLASGQEQYEAALRYQAQRRGQPGEPPGDRPWSYVLAHFASADAPGLEVQAVHRAITGLPAFELAPFQRVLGEYFDVEPLGSLRDVAGIAAQLEAAGRRGPAVAALSGGAARRRAGCVAILRGKLGAPKVDASSAVPAVDLRLVSDLAVRPCLGLDIAADPLPAGVEPIAGLEAALQRGRDKAVQLVLLFNPPSLADLRRLGEHGVTVPLDCVRFFPPSLTGLAMHDLSTL